MPLKITYSCLTLYIYKDKILCIIHKKSLQRGRKYNPSLTGGKDRSSDIFSLLCKNLPSQSTPKWQDLGYLLLCCISLKDPLICSFIHLLHFVCMFVHFLIISHLLSAGNVSKLYWFTQIWHLISAIPSL